MQENIDNLTLASIKSRVKAFVVDDILVTLLSIALLWDFIETSSGDFLTILEIMNANIVQLLFIKFSYHAFFIWYYGATLGKMFAKIKVIDYDDFGKVSFVNSAVRSSLRIVSEMFFYIGFVMAYFNQERQTLQDKFGKTLVVNA